MTYRAEVSVALHEAAHLAAAIHVNAEVFYAEVGFDGETAGKVVRKAGSPADLENGAFISLSGIVASEIFHLCPFGLDDDWKNVRKCLAEKSSAVERKIRWKVRRFISKNKLRIFRLAYALQTLKRIDGAVAKSIYENEKMRPDDFPTFMEAIRSMPRITWAWQSPSGEILTEAKEISPG
jgi:hypothetical protein